MKIKYSAVLLLVLLAVNLNAANLIDQTWGVGVGSFEQGTFVNGKGVEFLPYVPDFQRVLAGDTSITGWQVGGSGVDWLTIPAHLVPPGAIGVRSVDLAAQTAGWIQTSFPTITGQSYTVSFDSYGGQIVNLGAAVAGNVNLTFQPHSVTDAWVATFDNYSFDFVANSDTSTLRFEALRSDGFGPVIDHVSVDTSVPEPAISLVGLFIGLGVFFLGKKSLNR
jgi:hypothetical protein